MFSFLSKFRCVPGATAFLRTGCYAPENIRIIYDVWRLLILSNEEKGMIMKILKKEWLWTFWKKGGSREKGGGGNEIHAPCACGHDTNSCTYTTFVYIMCISFTMKKRKKWNSSSILLHLLKITKSKISGHFLYLPNSISKLWLKTF